MPPPLLVIPELPALPLCPCCPSTRGGYNPFASGLKLASGAAPILTITCKCISFNSAGSAVQKDGAPTIQCGRWRLPGTA